ALGVGAAGAAHRAQPRRQVRARRARRAPARRGGAMSALHAAAVPRWRHGLVHEYAPLVEKLERLIPCLEVPLHLPWIDAINALKRERGAVVMAHSYQSPEFLGVADVTGDSLAAAPAWMRAASASTGRVTSRPCWRTAAALHRRHS